MSIGFHPSNYDGLDICTICREDLIDPNQAESGTNKLVEHAGDDGQTHPFHSDCIKKWMLRDRHCPVCRIELDPNTLLSMPEKIWISLTDENGTLRFIATRTALLSNVLLGSVVGQGIASIFPAASLASPISDYRLLRFIIASSTVLLTEYNQHSCLENMRRALGYSAAVSFIFETAFQHFDYLK
jgi:hypothetical protein